MGSEEAARKPEGHPELRRVLWACDEYRRGESMPEEERSIRYSRVIEPFRQRFGGSFHPSKLRRPARPGFPEPEEASRGGRGYQNGYPRARAARRISSIRSRMSRRSSSPAISAPLSTSRAILGAMRPYLLSRP